MKSALSLIVVLLLGPSAWAQGDEPLSERDADNTVRFEAEEALRQRLTEREDKRRPPDPWSVAVAGRPLTISGEYDIGLSGIRRQVVGEQVTQPDRVLFENELEIEAFYSFGPQLSLFAQLRLGAAEDQLADTVDPTSETYLERGEMWLYSEDVAGTGADLDLGRLNFEDERRWWWDADLDAIRVVAEPGPVTLGVALAEELAPARSGDSRIAAEDQDVLRVFAELAWDWSPRHRLELFLLYQDDHSGFPSPGQLSRDQSPDEFDADLTWFGARSSGISEAGSDGYWGYWVDGALLRGSERQLEFAESDSGESVVSSVRDRDVRGWAVDLGFIGILPFRFEPRVFAAYAYGSGDDDDDPESRDDRAFQQTGIHSNEAGFGGVERYANYGVLLNPELSNLRISTLGAGISLWRASSLDLVYHHYRLVRLATSLRDAGLELELSGEHRALGEELDLVLAVEEWERLELLFFASAFKAGRALGERQGEWSYGGFVGLRYAF
jgi:hypothetical protein